MFTQLAIHKHVSRRPTNVVNLVMMRNTYSCRSVLRRS